MPPKTGVSSRKPVLSAGLLTSVVLLCEALALCGWMVFAYGAVHLHNAGFGPMFPSDHPLTDFYLYKPTFALYHTDAFNHDIAEHARFAYPPLLAPVYEFFYALPHRTTFFLLCFAVVWAAVFLWSYQVLRPRLSTGWQRLAFWGCLSLCYPAAFLLDRGNLEIFVWATILLALWLLRRNRLMPAGVAFGLAAACKLYPVLLFGLLLYKRSLRALVLGLLTAVLATVAALWWSGPTFLQAVRGFAGGIGGFQQSYAGTLRVGEIMYDHSLFSVVKTLAVHAHRNFSSYSHAYYAVGALMFGSLYLLRIRRGPQLNHIVFLVTCMVLLPPVSYLYTLVHLYIPAMLVAASLARSPLKRTWAGTLTLLCLLGLMMPIDVYPRVPVFYAGQLQTMLLLCTSFLACFAYQSTPQAAVSTATSPLVPARA